jgi:hypothetical protein
MVGELRLSRTEGRRCSISTGSCTKELRETFDVAEGEFGGVVEGLFGGVAEGGVLFGR